MFKNENFKWMVSLVILIMVIFAFYWYQLRPDTIVRACAKQSLVVLEESDYYDTAKYENTYRNCLRLNGLE